jgi:hypothetical protein
VVIAVRSQSRRQRRLQHSGSDEGIAHAGTTLWFAVTGTDNVAAINAATLDPSNYNPPETLIPVGFMPENLAATPNGSEVWVADSGPQTDSKLGDVEVISTSTDSVVGHLNPFGNPSDLAFSPDGSEAFVTTSAGLFVYASQPCDRSPSCRASARRTGSPSHQMVRMST